MGNEGTYYNVGDPEVRQNWERELHVEVVRRTGLTNPKYGLVGDGPEFVIERKRETFKKGGTSARLTLLRQLTGEPTRGNQTQREREEGQDTSTFDFQINKIRHAVKTDGEIVDQRVTWDTLRTSRILLGTYWASLIEAGACMQASGYDINTSRPYGADRWLQGAKLNYTANNAPRRPSELNKLWAKDLASDDEIGDNPSAYIDLNEIDTCIAMSSQLPVPIRQAMIHGEELNVLLLHTNATRMLRRTHSDWFALMSNTLANSPINKHPLVRGTLGIYNNTLVIETPYMPPGIGADGLPVPNTRLAVFGGAQMLALGLGKRYANENAFKWADEKWDYGDKFGVAAGLIYGLAAPGYELSEDGEVHDYGRIVMCGYAKDLVKIN